MTGLMALVQSTSLTTGGRQKTADQETESRNRQKKKAQQEQGGVGGKWCLCVCVGGGITGGAVGVIKSLGYFFGRFVAAKKVKLGACSFRPLETQNNRGYFLLLARPCCCWGLG